MTIELEAETIYEDTDSRLDRTVGEASRFFQGPRIGRGSIELNLVKSAVTATYTGDHWVDLNTGQSRNREAPCFKVAEGNHR
jgi:hypothetical protein